MKLNNIFIITILMLFIAGCSSSYDYQQNNFDENSNDNNLNENKEVKIENKEYITQTNENKLSEIKAEGIFKTDLNNLEITQEGEIKLILTYSGAKKISVNEDIKFNFEKYQNCKLNYIKNLDTNQKDTSVQILNGQRLLISFNCENFNNKKTDLNGEITIKSFSATTNLEYQTKIYFKSDSISFNTDLIPEKIGDYKLKSSEVENEDGNLGVSLTYENNENHEITIVLIKMQNESVKKELNSDLGGMGYLNYDSSNNKYLISYDMVIWYTNNYFDLILLQMEMNYLDYNISKKEVITNEFYKAFTKEFPIDNAAYNNLNITSYEEFYEIAEEIYKLKQQIKDMSKSLDVGRESQERITTDIEVVQVYANDTTDGIINYRDSITLIARLGSGSAPVKLTDLLIKLDTMTGSQTISYGTKSSTDFYEVSYISGSGNPIAQGYISTGDLVQITFKNQYDIKQGQTATIRLLTKNGAVKHVDLTTPSSMTKITTYLYP